LFFMLAVIVQKGIARLDSNLITKQPSKIRPQTAGVQSALLGTLWVGGLTALIAMPLGIAAAIYLEEYASSERWWNRAIELNIQNLAAVPAVIYGILTLGFVVRGPVSIGAVVMAGGIALALLILPVIIITTREALRSVPREIRDGSLALGATPWQTTWHQVLPAAVPGIATGSILAMSRAIGEAAPLILVGATTFVTFNPDGVLSKYTTLPVQIYNLVPQDRAAFRDLAYAAILLLIAVLLAMNAVAIWLRNHYQRRW
jgi:phosphate transport system permease protein